MEQIPYFDRRALRHARFGDGRQGAAIDPHLGAGDRLARPAAQDEMRYRGDARERLAAESQRGNAVEVFRAAYLARGVTFHGQTRILRLHALAVVLDANQLLAAQLRDDHDSARAGVNRVLDQLLDDRCRPLDDFASGDLVGKVLGKNLDAGHRQIHLFDLNTASITPAITTIIATTNQN